MREMREMRRIAESTWRGCRGQASALCLALLVAAAPGAGAEVQRFESVGAVAIDLDAPEAIAPRDAAIDRAILEAVERVARGLLEAEAERQRVIASTLPADPEAGTGDPGDTPDDPPDESLEPDFESLLGKKMELYASRYRVLEDRGEGPAIFSSEPDATTEYVVIVEVFVDSDRVRRRLVGAQLIPAGAGGALAERIRIEVVGLDAYPGYLALRDLLQTKLGALSVIPVEIERGRSLLEVETSDDALVLLDKLLEQASPEIEIAPLVPDGSDIRLAVHWTPLLPESEDDVSPVARSADDAWDGDPSGSVRFDPEAGDASLESNPRRP